MGIEVDSALAASDDRMVEEHLRARLERMQSATALQILEIDSADDARSAFLTVTKKYHPTRFARCNPEVRKLANEVFLRFKDAYSRLSASAGQAAALNPAGATPDRVRAPEQSGAAGEPSLPAATTSRPAAAAADPESRRRLRERRKDALRRQLTGSRPAVQAQVASTSVQTGASGGDPDTLEAEFADALAELKAGRIAEAAELFKALAVSNPADKKYRLYMHYARGRLHQSEDKVEEARSEFKRALGLDADFGPALQSMAALPGEGKKKDRPLFSRLFRR